MKIAVLCFVLAVMLLASVACAEPVHAPEGKQIKVQWAVLQSKEGRMAEMGAIGARTVAPYTAREPGSYSLYGAVDRENPNIMRILEIYEDEAAYQVHRSSDGFKQFLEQRAPLLEKLTILPVYPIVLEQKAEGKGSIVTMTLVEVRPENLEDFRLLITAEMTRAVGEDAGVLGLFATSEQGERKNRIHTLEIFRDEKAREEYLNSTHYKEYRVKADAMLRSRRIFENYPVQITLSAKGLHRLSPQSE